MTELREPTHILTVTVPLDLTGTESFDYHPTQDALAVVLAVSRIAAAGVLCGDANVTLTPAAPGD